MNERMPVWASIDPIRKHWLGLLILIDVLYGGINVFTPAQSAPQILLREVLPIPVWGGMLVVCAVLVAFGWSVHGGVVGAFGWLAQAIASFATIVQGTALAYNGPILLGGMGAFHALITYDVGSGLDARRERQQRR
jgi:hypothetical protein